MGTHDRIYHNMRFMLDGSRDNILFYGEGGRIYYEKTDGRRRYRINIQNFKRNTEKKIKAGSGRPAAGRPLILC